MQLQDSLAQFSASGIRIFAISPDSVEDLAAFAALHGITYPLLSDQRSEVIRDFGILNTLIRDDEPEYGIPYPGSYLVASDGRVAAKSFHREYQVREAAPTVLRSGFGVGAAKPSTAIADRPDSRVAVEVALGASTLSFMQRADLYVSLDLADGIHVYGRPIPAGYQPIDVRVAAQEGVRVGEAVYAAPRPFRIAGLDEQFYVYEGRAAVRVPIVLAVRPTDTLTQLTVEVQVRYQACTDKECFAPTSHNALIVVPLQS